MRWNPFLNALGAALYVWGIGFLIHYLSSLHRTPNSTVGSIAAMSLVTFSAAIMGFLFFYRPVQLLIEGNKREAVLFFLKTLAAFGVITLIAVLFVL